MKKLTEYQTNKAKALAIELAAIDRHRWAYVMRSAVRLLFFSLGSPAAAWIAWKLSHGGW